MFILNDSRCSIIQRHSLFSPLPETSREIIFQRMNACFQRRDEWIVEQRSIDFRCQSTVDEFECDWSVAWERIDPTMTEVTIDVTTMIVYPWQLCAFEPIERERERHLLDQSRRSYSCAKRFIQYQKGCQLHSHIHADFTSRPFSDIVVDTLRKTKSTRIKRIPRSVLVCRDTWTWWVPYRPVARHGKEQSRRVMYRSWPMWSMAIEKPDSDNGGSSRTKTMMDLLLSVSAAVGCIESIARRHPVLRSKSNDSDAHRSPDYVEWPFLWLIPGSFKIHVRSSLHGCSRLTSAVVASLMEYSESDPSSRKTCILFVSSLKIGSILCTGFLPWADGWLALDWRRALNWLSWEWWDDLRLDRRRRWWRRWFWKRGFTFIREGRERRVGRRRWRIHHYVWFKTSDQLYLHR